jgi:hypothetical protein
VKFGLVKFCWEYDTVARADNYFAEYRMLFLRRRGNERDIFKIALDGMSLLRGSWTGLKATNNQSTISKQLTMLRINILTIFII